MWRGPLHGVPVAVKDTIATAGVATSRGTLAFADFVPTRSAPAVARLLAAGACLIGKTTTPEFGFKAVTDSPLTGITRNPFDPSRTCGGSSGGSAVAVASGAACLGVGTDAGGSVRIPAAFCGILGLKPTWGRIPHGMGGDVLPIAHTGLLARHTEDLRLSLRLFAADGGEPRIGPAGAPRDSRRLRIGYLPALQEVPVDKPVARHLADCVDRLHAYLDCTVETIDTTVLDFGNVRRLWESFYARGMLELYSSAAPCRRDLFSDDYLAEVDLAGQRVRVDPAEKLDDELRQLRRSLASLWGRYDVLLTPTTPTTAFDATHQQPSQALAGRTWWGYTQIWNVTGDPSCSVPYGFDSQGLPVGVQVVGPANGDEAVLSVAGVIERIADDTATDWMWQRRLDRKGAQ